MSHTNGLNAFQRRISHCVTVVFATFVPFDKYYTDPKSFALATVNAVISHPTFQVKVEALYKSPVENIDLVWLTQNIWKSHADEQPYSTEIQEVHLMKEAIENDLVGTQLQ